MKKILVILILLGLFLVGCSSGNLDNVKENATEVFHQAGFKIVGYEGFQWGFCGVNSYGGAKVWYVLHRIPDNGITYVAYLQRWGDEYHIYNLRAIDAIKP